MFLTKFWYEGKRNKNLVKNNKICIRDNRGASRNPECVI